MMKMRRRLSNRQIIVLRNEKAAAVAATVILRDL
jgi:hypothetical protein